MKRAALLLCAGCALPVVSAGTFLPAGDLRPGEVHASVSMEAGRVGFVALESQAGADSV